jgi:hypothetical protein
VYWSISTLLAHLRGNHNRDREVAILFRLDG